MNVQGLVPAASFVVPTVVINTMKLIVDALPDALGCFFATLTPRDQTSSRLISKKEPRQILLGRLPIRIWYDKLHGLAPERPHEALLVTIGHG